MKLFGRAGRDDANRDECRDVGRRLTNAAGFMQNHGPSYRVFLSNRLVGRALVFGGEVLYAEGVTHVM